MLIQFSVSNFKSIKDEITLDMQATSITEHKEHLIGSDLLRVAVIYGPNGGGKSNILQALNAICDKVTTPISLLSSVMEIEYERVPLLHRDAMEPFKFNSKTLKKPAQFELFIKVINKEYKYAISILENRIVSESLHVLEESTDEQTLIYDYKNNNYILSDEIKISGIETTKLNNNVPLLSYLAIVGKNLTDISNVTNWFATRFVYINSTKLVYNRINRNLFLSNFMKKNKETFIKMLNEMDIDIIDLRTIKNSEASFLEYFTKHAISDDEFELNLNEESSGTQKLFVLLPRILNSLSNGVTCVIDELDAQLHPRLLEYIISLFTNPISNSNNAQLIFTSHDLSTMTSEIFRRDEIWFAAKNNEQATSLYSLVEIKNEKGKITRKDAAFNKQYLEGKYGADPYLRKIINWEVKK